MSPYNTQYLEEEGHPAMKEGSYHHIAVCGSDCIHVAATRQGRFIINVNPMQRADLEILILRA